MAIRKKTEQIAKWQAYFPDSLPGNADLGLGSPTAMSFGTDSNFPDPYRRALFILDWAYGKIIAVHLMPEGASYRGQGEEFGTGRPLNGPGVDFGPDGSMYFVTGGRRTQSGLYRVRYVGGESLPSLGQAAAGEAKRARELRRRLERSGGPAGLWRCERDSGNRCVRRREARRVGGDVGRFIRRRLERCGSAAVGRRAVRGRK